MARKDLNITSIQIILWVIVYLLMLSYSIRDAESLARGLFTSTNNLFTFLLAIYSQSNFLIPRFLEKDQRREYFLFTGIFIIVLVFFRASAEYLIINKIIGLTHFYNLGLNHFALAFLTVFLCQVIGVLLRVSINYVTLLKKHETLKLRQNQSELDMLKLQVQPHFMFNTLNNIYSLAIRKSDKTADLVARLSDIMRYFVQDASKEVVPLSHEMKLLKNYIELEQIRLLHPLKSEFKIMVSNEDQLLPPMLFMPFVENVFKHGVDKMRNDNYVNISITEFNDQLVFEIENSIVLTKTETDSGVGLLNLKKRLDILYAQRYELVIDRKSESFNVKLTIPLQYDVTMPGS